VVVDAAAADDVVVVDDVVAVVDVVVAVAVDVAVAVAVVVAVVAVVATNHQEQDHHLSFGSTVWPTQPSPLLRASCFENAGAEVPRMPIAEHLTTY